MKRMIDVNALVKFANGELAISEIKKLGNYPYGIYVLKEYGSTPIFVVGSLTLNKAGDSMEVDGLIYHPENEGWYVSQKIGKMVASVDSDMWVNLDNALSLKTVKDSIGGIKYDHTITVTQTSSGKKFYATVYGIENGTEINTPSAMESAISERDIAGSGTLGNVLGTWGGTSSYTIDGAPLGAFTVTDTVKSSE